MSTRLKRKLGDMGIDPSSAKANESFCLIGTPLPPLEKSKDNGEFVPLWKQDVRDEQGRRRLHGAFTGGFSAGYFNSVGSKEGWTPATFTSSRNDRSKKKAARPEDFMDEEDLQELRDSKNLVDTTDEMDLDQRGATTVDPEQESMASVLESAMLPAPTDSAGARILKKMGWRIGQGIGPRVSYRQRKLQDLQASLGPSRRITGDAMVVDEDEEEASKHTYAPRDTPILLVDRKDNSHGIGYNPGMGLNASLGVKGGKGPIGPKLSAGFGLGALNDADEDDLDVYDGSINRGRSTTAYDIIDGDDDDKIVIGSKSQDRNRKTYVRPVSSRQTFQDGQPVLDGFVLSGEPVAEDRWFPMPDIPKGWKPAPSRVWDKDSTQKENQDPAALAESTAHRKWNSAISADERGSILGETQLPSAPRSVFDYMSKKDRERLQNIAASRGNSSSTTETPGVAAPPPPATITIPKTEPSIAKAALTGFRPFPSDPVKQQRYTAYLQTQINPDVLPPDLLSGQTIEAFNKELEEYAKAALLFKPVSGAMAGRFTSAAVLDNGPVIHPGLHVPTAEDFERKEMEQVKRMEENIKPKEHAAKMGMYGPLTRESSIWIPAKLLCKRFGVKDPNPVSAEETDATKNPPPATNDEWKTNAGMGEKFATGNDLEVAMQQGSSSSMRTGTSGKKRDLANVGLGDDEEQGKDTLTYERPAMDIFKAIFASDDEESEDEEEKAEIPAPVLAKVVIAAAAPVASTSKIAEVATPKAEEKFDAASFKPTFIPRASAKSTEEGSNTGEKRKKKKSKSKTLLSFGADEEDEGSVAIGKEQRPKKKKRREKEKKNNDDNDDVDDGMWVEKPPPEIVKNRLEADVAMADGTDAGLTKGRKLAVDFM